MIGEKAAAMILAASIGSSDISLASLRMADV